MAKNALVKKLAEKGRNGDTILAHITPEEAAMLKAHGGSGTINPETGLPEYWPSWVEDLWDNVTGFVRQYAPIIMPAVAIFAPTLIPSIGTWLGATTATGAAVLGSAALSAGVTLAAGGSLKDVLTSAALAGGTTYLTPIIGQKIAGAIGVASPVATQLIGVAATSGGLAALRGGSVKQVMAAAATGAASSYLAGIAKEAFDNLNKGMANGTFRQVPQKAATDAVYVAADAANLKAAGLSEAQIADTLKSSGVNSGIAESAAQFAAQGKSAADIATNLATWGVNAYGTADAATKSITAGNNLDLVQRAEDATTIAQDAAQLKAQGLSAAQIKENLMATGVSEAVATTAASRAVSGYTADQIATGIQTYYKTGAIYDNTTNVIGRDIGEAMTQEQQETWRAQPYKASVDAGHLTTQEAAMLSQNGYTAADVNKLTSMGYTGADLTDLAATGIKASQLTGMGDLTLPESTVNDLLHAGSDIGTIKSVDSMVKQGTISADNAEKLLMKDYSSNTIYNLANKGQTTIDNIVKSGLSESSVNKMLTYGADINRAATLSAGGIDVNKLVAAGDWTGLRNATLVTTLPTEPTHYTSNNLTADIDFALADAKNLRAQGLNESQINQVLQSSGLSSSSASYLAKGVVVGYSDSTLKADLNSISGGKLYGVDPAIAIAQKAAADKAAALAPVAEYKPMIEAGNMDIATATQLKSAGYTPAQYSELSKLGYTAPDLVDLAAAGVKPATLTGLGDTIFDETKINDMLRAGASINDIKTVSNNFKNNLFGNLTPAEAEAMLMSGKSEFDVRVQNNQNMVAAQNAAKQPSGPTIPVKMPDGSVGAYDPATGDVHDANGTKIVSGGEPTVTPGQGTDVAGPYRVDVSGVIADDNMSPTVRAQHLKGAIPDGTVLANSETPGAYIDQASNAWVVKSGPVEITKPIQPVEIPPESGKVTPVEVGAPVAPGGGQTPVETAPGGPGSIVAPPGYEPVYDDSGAVFYFNADTGVVVDSSGQVVYEPPKETAPVAPVQPVTPVQQPQQPAPITAPEGQVLVQDESGNNFFFNPNTGVVTDTSGNTVYAPPETPAPPSNEPVPGTGGGGVPATGPTTPTVPETPAPSGPGTGGGTTPGTGGLIPVTGPDGGDYFYNPVDGTVVDSGGNPVSGPGTGGGTGGGTTPGTGEPSGPGTGGGTTPGTGGPSGPVVPTEPPVTQPPVTQPPTVEPPLKPLPEIEIPPSEKIPTIEVPETPPVETPTEPVIPPIIPPVVVPEDPNKPKVWDPVNVSFKTLPLLPNPGLNPGFIQAQQQYQPTSPVQSQYYWGQHPYQSGGADRMTFDPALYKQVPAPVQPWGLQELYTPMNIQEYLAQLQGQVGPVKP